jgi:hypothetical protein
MQGKTERLLTCPLLDAGHHLEPENGEQSPIDIHSRQLNPNTG